MTISVIVPAYERIVDILACLNSLQATVAVPQNVQFLIQDDMSPSLDLRALIPRCAASVERNERNLGFSGNCNQGAKRAQGDILCFVNQDILGIQQSQGWDVVIERAFEDASVGIAAPRLLFPDGKVQSVGGGYDARLQPYHRCIGWSNLEHHEVNTPQEVEWATGAFLAVRREAWEKVGGFDEAYISYFEDVDLAVRVKEAGYKVMFEPRVSFVHRVGSTGGSPYFMNSAKTFKTKWVDTRKIKADTSAVLSNWW